MLTKPMGPVQSIITPAEFAAWVSVDDTDPLIPMLSISATSAIINHLEMELISRQRKVIHRHWPTIGTDTSPSLSRPNVFPACVIELPYSVEAVVIDSALIYGDAVTLEAVEDRPFVVPITEPTYSTDDTEIAIDITYTTGYADIDAVPVDIKQAALTHAAYMYEHRGECDAMEGLKRSGAADLIQHYKTNLVVF